MDVFFESRPASRRVGNNSVEILSQERIEIPLSQFSRHIAHSGMRCQRTATSLRRRHDNFTAVRLQHANRRAVQFAEGNLRHTSGKKCDARAPFAPCWKRLE